MAADSRPNFLFIMTDQQRWDTVGAARPGELRTPNLDRLAAAGCNFGNAYCQGPICVPSRASFLTGKYVHQHCLYHNNCPLPATETTWGDVLRGAGWQTTSVGRVHTICKGFEHCPTPLGDSYLDFVDRLYGSNWTEFPYGHEDPRPYPGAKEDFVEFRRTRLACDLLRDLKAHDAPWALFLGYCAPHNPYILPQESVDLYADVEVRAPRFFEEDFRMPDYTEGAKAYFDLMQSRDPLLTVRYYYGMVSLIDECVGRVLEAVDALGLADNTIVIFTSDHGEMLGDHARWAKGNIHEESVKIPFIISGRDHVPSTREIPALVESVDLFPTIIDYAGVDMPNAAYRLPGRSLRGLMEGTAERVKDAVFAELPPWVMVRTEQWKLGYGYAAGDHYLDVPGEYTGILFDLANDPAERRNLFDDPQYEAQRNRLFRRLVDFHLDVKIPLHKDVTEIAFENLPNMPLCID